MAGGVLALDLSTHTGWARGRLPVTPMTPLEMATLKPEKPESGVAHFPGELGVALGQFETWIVGMLTEQRPAGVIFESPILPQKTTPATARKLMSLVGITLMACRRLKVQWIREAQPGSVKLFISGNGGKGKQNVMNAIRSFGWAFEDDNESDALALWCFAADLYAAERRARAA